MEQKYVVFRYDKKIILAEDINTANIPHENRTIHYSKGNLNKAYTLFCLDDTTDCLVILAPGCLEQAFSEFCLLFRIKQAAGGIVRNPRGEILLIKRWGKWDLPKGKLKKGEPPEKGALREISEETGLQSLKINSFITVIYHIYPQGKGKQILKKTFWFKADAGLSDKLIPQLEEDITEVKWFPPSAITDALENSYASLRYLFQQL